MLYAALLKRPYTGLKSHFGVRIFFSGYDSAHGRQRIRYMRYSYLLVFCRIEGICIEKSVHEELHNASHLSYPFMKSNVMEHNWVTYSWRVTQWFHLGYLFMESNTTVTPGY